MGRCEHLPMPSFFDHGLGSVIEVVNVRLVHQVSILLRRSSATFIKSAHDFVSDPIGDALKSDSCSKPLRVQHPFVVLSGDTTVGCFE